jgi:hypothetical protein
MLCSSEVLEMDKGLPREFQSALQFTKNGAIFNLCNPDWFEAVGDSVRTSTADFRIILSPIQQRVSIDFFQWTK